MLADALTILGAIAITVGFGVALGFDWASIIGGILLFLAARKLA